MQNFKTSNGPSAFKTGLRPFCSPKMTLFRGVGGSPKFFSLIGILIFLWVRRPCKISNSYDMPFCGFRYHGNKKNNKKRLISKIVAYGCQTTSAQRRSDQFSKSYCKVKNEVEDEFRYLFFCTTFLRPNFDHFTIKGFWRKKHLRIKNIQGMVIH